MLTEYAMSEQLRDDIKHWQTEEAKKLLEEIGGKVTDSILDFGCGDGWFTVAESFFASGGRVYGLDIHRESLDFLYGKKKEYGLNNLTTIHSKEGEFLSFGDCTLDLISLNDLIHELSDLDVLMGEFHRVLKEKGILAIAPFHMDKNEIERMKEDVEHQGFVLKNTVKQGSIHFGRVTKMDGAWKRLKDFERGDIYCFQCVKADR